MDKIDWIFLIGILFIIALAWVGASHDIKMKKQCVEDGKKEYECEMLLNRTYTIWRL